MASLPPEDVVRLLFDAGASGDTRRFLSLLAPDFTAVTIADGERLDGLAAARAYMSHHGPTSADGRRTEVQAHRLEMEGKDVIAHGRIRVFTHGSLSDSPAAWRVTVHDGLIHSIVPYVARSAAAAAAAA